MRRSAVACAIALVAISAPRDAFAFTSPIIVYQPTSATGPAWGTQRKLFRLANAARSLVAVYVNSNQLHIGCSNDDGATWTDSLVSGSGQPSVTAFTYGAAVDPATNMIHILFGNGPVGGASSIGYAVGTYSAGPGYTWEISTDALGNPVGNHYEFPSVCMAWSAGVAYVHVVFGEKEASGAIINRVRWNYRQAGSGTGGWLLGSPGRDITITMVTDNNAAVNKNPGPIPAIFADENNNLWTSWYNANKIFYIRRLDLSGGSWTEAPKEYTQFAVGTAAKGYSSNLPCSGMVHSCALKVGGGQIAYLFPTSQSQVPTSWQLLLNNTTATSWMAPGASPQTITNINFKNAGDGFPSISSEWPAGTYDIFFSDTGKVSGGEIYYYRYPQAGVLSAKAKLWDDPANTGNRLPCAGLDTSLDTGVIWSGGQTTATRTRYINLGTAPLRAAISTSASELCEGWGLSVTLTVTNTGTLTVGPAVPTLDIRPAGGDSVSFYVVSTPVSITVPGGSSVNFTWTLSVTGFTPRVTGLGSVTMTASATGAWWGTWTYGGATAGPLSVHGVPSVAGSIAVSATTVSTGRPFTVRMTITNTGGGPLAGVAPALEPRASGGGAVSLSPAFGPVPPTADVCAGCSTTFVWTYTATAVGAPGSGSIVFSGTVTGSGGLCGSTVTATALSVPVLVQGAAALDGGVIVAGPDPVCVGSVVSILQTVTNTGASAVWITPSSTPMVSGTGAAVWVTSPPASIRIAGGAAAVVGWTMRVTAGGTLRFTATCSGYDEVSGAPVTTGPATTAPINASGAGGIVADAASPDMASIGQWFLVQLTVTNTGGIPVGPLTPAMVIPAGAGNVVLKAGPSPASVASLAAGASTVFTWTYSASGAGNVEFDPSVTGLGCGTTTLTMIWRPAGIAAALSAVPAQRTTGQSFLVTLDITNSGDSPALNVNTAGFRVTGSGAATLTAGPAPPLPLTLAGGGHVAVTWMYTAMSPGVVTLSTTVTGTDEASGGPLNSGAVASGTVLIQSPAALGAAMAAPPTVCVGRTFMVSMTVTNTGGATATGLSPQVVRVTGTSGLVFGGGPVPPAPLDLPGGTAVTFTWSYTGVAAGTATFSSTATATDANTGWPVTSPPAATPEGVISPGVALAAAFSAPPTISPGQWFRVALTVTNMGGSAATGVSPGLAIGPGGSLVTLKSGPTPAGPLTIPAGGATTFAWTYSASGAGTAVFTATASGTDACGAVTAAAGGSVAIQTPAALEASVAYSNNPANTNQTIDVTVTITNTGGTTALGVNMSSSKFTGTAAAFFVDGPFPDLPVDIPGGSAVTVAWTYQMTSVGTMGYSITVTGTDANRGTSVKGSSGVGSLLVVQIPAAIQGSAAMMGASVCQGRPVLVCVTVTNTGGAGATLVQADPWVQSGGGALSPVDGPNPAMPADIPGFSSRTFSWTFTGLATGSVAVITTVNAADANDGTWISTGVLATKAVSVTPGALPVVVARTPATVSAGQWFRAELTVTNTGAAGWTGVVPAIAVGPGAALVAAQGGVSPAGPVTIPAGGTVTFAWTYSASGVGGVAFAMTLTGADGCGSVAASATSFAVIQVPAALNVSTALFPVSVQQGGACWLTVTVTNTGGAAAAAVAPGSPIVSGSGSLGLLGGPWPPAPVGLAGGASVTFTWSWSGSSIGTVWTTTTVTGLDANSGAPLSSGPRTSSAITVAAAGSLAAASAISPQPVSLGQWITVWLTVTNQGGTAANNVTPSVANGSGAALVLKSGPTPPGPVTIPAGGAATFSWTYSTAGAGTITLSLTATGTDAVSGAPLYSAGMVGGQVLTPAALAAAAAAYPSPRNLGQSFTVTVTVTNTGSTAATGVTAAAFLTSGAGGAMPSSGPAPSMPVTLAGGAAQTFTWVFTGTRTGSVAVSTTVTGTDAMTGQSRSAAVITGPVSIEAPAHLAASASVPGTACLGSVLLVCVTVTNTGEAGAAGVAPAVPSISGAGNIALSAGPDPAMPVALAAGASQVFTWTYTGAAAGIASVTVTVTGTDVNDGAGLAAAPTAPPLNVTAGAAPVAAWHARPQVSVGQWFTVDLTVTVTGTVPLSGGLPGIAVGPGASLVVAEAGPVPPGPLAIAAGGSETFTWTYSPTGAGNVAFAATVTGSDTCGADSASGAGTVVVQAAAVLSAAVSTRPASVGVGQTFQVCVTVSNTGGATATGVTPAGPWISGTGGASVVGGPSPAAPVSVPGGGMVVFTWTYTATSAGSLGFMSTVAGNDGNAGWALSTGMANSPSMTVLPGAALSSAAAVGPPSVSAGQWITVTLTVTNTGGTAASAVTPGLVNSSGASMGAVSGPVPPGPVGLPPASSATFAWTFSTSGAGSVSFSVTATGIDAASGATVYTTVNVTLPGGVVWPAALAAAAAAFPSGVQQGEAFRFTLTVTNTGGAPAAGVTPAAPAVSGSGSAGLLAGPWPPSPVSIGPGAMVVFTWTYSGAAVGNVWLTTTVAGADGYSGLPLAPRSATAGPVAVASAGALASAVAISPQPVSTGQWITVWLTVTNEGGTSANGVTPSVANGSSAGLVLMSGPTPPGPLVLAPAAAATFAWTYSTSGAGVVMLSLTATGVDGMSGAPLYAAGSVGGQVQSPALLRSSLTGFPPTRNIGQCFLVCLTVTNAGGAPAAGVNVPATPFAISGNGGVIPAGGPLPGLPVLLPGGSAMTFSWTYAGAAKGDVWFTTTVTGSDANSGFAIGSAPATSAKVKVQNPAKLKGHGASHPSAACEGDSYLVTITVTNTGDASADAVTPAAPFVDGSGSLSLLAGPAPGSVGLAGGESFTFTWTYTGALEGSVAVTTTVTGTDATDGTQQDTGAVSLGAQVWAHARLKAALAAARPVSKGQWFTVSLSVTNTGTYPATALAPAISAGPGGALASLVGGPTPSGLATLAAGASTRFEWTWSASGAGTVVFTATVTAADGCSVIRASATGFTVVESPAALAAFASAFPSPRNPGQAFLVVMTVSNTGGAWATGVGPLAPAFSGTGAASVMAGPNPAGGAVLAPGAAAVFTWTCAGSAVGSVAASATVTGWDLNSGMPAASGLGVSNPVAIQPPAVLAGAVSFVPGVVCPGDLVRVCVTVTNTGTSGANGVFPALPSVAGPGSVALAAGPWPATPVPVPGGGAVVFTWTYTASTAGWVGVTTTVTGTDSSDGSPVASPPAFGTGVVGAVATLAGSVSAPPVASSGQWFPVTITVTNTGAGTATGLAPAISAGPGGSLATLVAGPVPAGLASLAPGASGSFVWTYSASGGAGGITFTATVTAFDGCAATAAAGRASLTLANAAALSAALSAGPTPRTTGQSFLVAVTVTNTGGGTANGVMPAAPQTTGPGSAALTAGPFPASPVPVAGGASATFSWVFTAVSGGAVVVTTTVTGTDANTGAPLLSGLVVSNTVAIMTPAALAASAVAMTAGPCTGGSVLVCVTVTNTGMTAANGVIPAPPTMNGPGAVALSAGPFPSPPVVLPGGASMTFTWTWTAMTAGPVVVTTTITGTDALGGSPVGSGPAAAGLTVYGIPNLSASLSAPANVSVGQWFTVNLTVTNSGAGPATGPTPAMAIGPGAGLAVLQSGPNPPGLSWLAAGASTTFTWTWSAAGAGAISFTATVTSAGGCGNPVASASTSLLGQAPAALASAAALFPAAVQQGQRLFLTLTVTNTGGATATVVAPSVPMGSGPGSLALLGGPFPAGGLALAGGASVTFTWTYSGGALGNAFLTVNATGTDANTGRALSAGAQMAGPVSVVAAGALVCAARSTALPITAGQWITAWLTVTNTGGTAANNVTPAVFNASSAALTLVSGPVPPGPLVLAPGAATTFAWTWSAAGAGAVSLSLTATGSDAVSGAGLYTAGSVAGSVLSRAALAVSVCAYPTPRNVGESFLVTVTVTNTGATGATGVNVAPFSTGGGGGATQTAGPIPALPVSLAGGAATTITWMFTAASPGGIVYSTTLSGIDAGTGQPVSSAPAASSQVSIQAPAALVGSASGPAGSVNVGQQFLVCVTVTNTGTSGAVNVAPAVPVVSGTGAASIAAGPNPAGAVGLPGGTARTFTWTFTGLSGGTVTITATVVGSDASDGSPRTTGPVSIPPLVVIGASGNLAGSVSGPAFPVQTGNTIAVSITVTNTGGSAANNVVPGLWNTSAAGLTLMAGPTPPGPLTLGPGTAATFSWSWLVTGAGSISFSITATGTDAMGGGPLYATGIVAGAAQARAVFAAALAAPAGMNAGATDTVSLTVTNTGAGTASGVVPSLAILPGGLSVVAGPAPASAPTLVPGGAVTFVWTVSATGAGSIVLTATASGTDAWGAVSASAARGLTVTATTVAALSVSSLVASPAAAAPGGTITVVMTAANTGSTILALIVPDPLAVEGPGSAVLLTGPLPAQSPVLAPGVAASFTWTYRAVQGPSVAFRGGAAASGGVDAADVASGSVAIDDPADNLESILVYPNPFSPTTAPGGMIRFQMIPPGSTIRVFTAAGELVRKLDAGAAGMAEWDGRNGSGTGVEPGVYFWIAKAPDGSKKTGKVYVFE